MKQLHATTLQLNGKGVMLCGPSASGKSDLGLRLIEGGAILVADDRTDLILDKKSLIAKAPEEIIGQIEVRGIGIVKLEVAVQTHLAMVVNLKNTSEIQRLPKKNTIDILGVRLPLIEICAFEASAPAKVRTALMHYTEIK